jgi:hypothetical protein
MEGSRGKGEGSKIKIGRELKKEEWCSRKVGRKFKEGGGVRGRRKGLKER